MTAQPPRPTRRVQPPSDDGAQHDTASHDGASDDTASHDTATHDPAADDTVDLVRTTQTTRRIQNTLAVGDAESTDDVETTETVQEVVEASGPGVSEALERGALAGSLFEPVVESDDDNEFGALGPPVSRQAPFYKGFLGALGVLVAILAAVTVREASSVLVLVLVSGFLAVGLNPLVEFLIKRRVPRGWAVLVVAVVVVAFVSMIVVVVGGVLRNQVTTLIDDAPKLLSELREHKSIARLDNRYHFIGDLQKRLKDPNFAAKTFGGVYNVGLSLFTAATDVVIAFILTLYFLVALPQIKRGMFSLAPASRRHRVNQLGDEILRRVGRYVSGAFSVALLAGTVSLVFLLLVGLGQYALPLAVLVALFDLVPLVGSILGASIVSIVGLANSLSIGIACIVFYLVYETLEGYVIYPRVMRSSVDVPEYVTIVAVLLGGAVAGVLGALLALPMAAAILLIVREVWVRRQDLS